MFASLYMQLRVQVKPVWFHGHQIIIEKDAQAAL